MNNTKRIRFSSLYAVPSRNGVYVTKENHGFGTPIINMGELFANEFIRHGEGESIHLSNKEKEFSILEDGDLLFARRSLVESGAGKCSIVINPSEDMTFESSVIRIRLDKAIANPLFYYYWFKSNTGRSAIRTLVTGSNVKGIKGSELGTLEVPFVPIEEQNTVSSILWDIDKKIANNTAICSDLESMAKLLYDYWFVQFEFPDKNGRPYKSSGGKMVWNEELKREIPEGWEVKDILDVCDVIDCLHSKKPDYCYESDDRYLLTLENLTQEGYINLTDKYYISKEDYELWSSKIEVGEGDFVVTNAGRAGDIGRIPKGVRCAIGRNFTAIHPKKIDSIYLNMYLHSFYVRSQIMSNLDQGSFFMSFNVYAIKKLKVLIPDDYVMKKTIRQFTDIVTRIDLLLNENQQFTSLRDFLLPMLMNGQVKVADKTSEE